MRRVIKYGGTSIESAERVRRAAQTVARLCLAGEQVAVVVSAQGNDTNVLLGAAYAATERQIDPQALYRIAAMGEEKSVHLLTAALRSLGVDAAGFYPTHGATWPLIVNTEDGAHMLAAQKINEERPLDFQEEESRRLCQERVLPLLRRGGVAVLSGFFARSTRGELTTLGRGGSDISGALAARALDADELVIVTDVEGVLSADPRLLADAAEARLIADLSVAELEVLASRGARVVHPRALRYLPSGCNARVVDYRRQEALGVPDAPPPGTTLTGSGRATLTVRPEPLCMITVMGRDLSTRAGVLAALGGALAQAGVPIVAANSNDAFLCFYLFARDAEVGYRALHAAVVARGADSADAPLSNVTLRRDVAELRLRSPEYLQTPGVLAEITAALGRRKVNILEMITSLTDISVYVDQADRDAAQSLLSALLPPSP